MKSLYDRAVYALIGFCFGAVIAVVLWYLYDAGFSRRFHAPEIHMPLADWIKYVGGFFALLGFIFKENAGTAVGSTVNDVYTYEANRNEDFEIPHWLVVPLLIVIAVVAYWYFSKAQ